MQAKALPQYFDAVEPTHIDGAVYTQIVPVLGANEGEDIGLDLTLYCQQAALNYSKETQNSETKNTEFTVQSISFDESAKQGACHLQSGPLYEPAQTTVKTFFANNVFPAEFRGQRYNASTIWQYCDQRVRTLTSTNYNPAPDSISEGTVRATIRCFSPDTAFRAQWFNFSASIEGKTTQNCETGTLTTDPILGNVCLVGTQTETYPFEIVTTVTPPSTQCPDDYPELDEQAQLCTTTGASAAPYITQQLQSDSTNGAFKHLPLAISGFVATAALGLGVYQLAGRLIR